MAPILSTTSLLDSLNVMENLYYSVQHELHQVTSKWETTIAWHPANSIQAIWGMGMSGTKRKPKSGRRSRHPPYCGRECRDIHLGQLLDNRTWVSRTGKHTYDQWKQISEEPHDLHTGTSSCVENSTKIPLFPLHCDPALGLS